MGLDSPTGLVVAIVTGGSVRAGLHLARELARFAWPIVIVYLEHQPRVEATVAEIIAAGGSSVAVRAELADDLDIERLFGESIAAFGGVDVVVNTSTDSAAALYEHAARNVRQGGALVTTSAAELIPPQVASELSHRGVTVGRVPPEAVVPFLDRWWHQSIG